MSVSKEDVSAFIFKHVKPAFDAVDLPVDPNNLREALDSLDIIELTMALEIEYDISISEDEMDDIASVHSLATLVCAKLQQIAA